MKALVSLIVLLTLAGLLTFLLQANPGQVVLFVPPWQIALSLNTLIIVLLLLQVVGYALIRTVVVITQLPARIAAYRTRKAERRLIELERQACLAFFEGRYQQVERLANETLKKTSHDQDTFAINGLLAAYAAHHRGDQRRRDEYFQQLDKRLGAGHLALAITMAQFFLEDQRDQDTEDAITRAKTLAPTSTAVLTLELRLRQRQKKYKAILELAAQLAKSKALSETQLRTIRMEAHHLRVQGSPQDAHLAAWLSSLPHQEQTDTALVTAVVHRLIAQGAVQTARDILEKTLDAAWSSTLVEVYGTLALEGQAITAALEKAEGWLKKHPDDPLLLLTLGRLCTRNNLWGKAQTYLEASLALQPDWGVHASLAQLCDRLQKEEVANQHYRACVALLKNALPPLWQHQ